MFNSHYSSLVAKNDGILITAFISASKMTPLQKYTETISSSSVTIIKIFVNYTQMALGWGTE